MLFRSQKPNLPRLAGARVCIAYLVNVGLGSLWNAILFKKAFWFYAAKSLVKNTAMIPIEVAVLLLLFQALAPALRRFGLAPESGK